MRSNFYLLIAFFLLSSIPASGEDFTIGTVGLNYSPSSITVNFGDNVTIQASNEHPTTQVSQATWNANGTTSLAGGFGRKTTEFSIMILSLETIFFVCENHISEGMKGRIIVSPTSNSSANVNKIGFELFPNPSTAEKISYIIHSPDFSSGQMSIYDLAGQLVVENEAILRSGRLNLNVPNGTYIYILRSRDEELLAAGRLIVAGR